MDQGGDEHNVGNCAGEYLAFIKTVKKVLNNMRAKLSYHRPTRLNAASGANKNAIEPLPMARPTPTNTLVY